MVWSKAIFIRKENENENFKLLILRNILVNFTILSFLTPLHHIQSKKKKIKKIAQMRKFYL